MAITTIDQLKIHLKVLRMKLVNNGITGYELYPQFCLYYAKNKEKYQLPKEVVLEHACEILIEN